MNKRFLWGVYLMLLSIITSSAAPTWRETRKVIFTPPAVSKAYLIEPGQALNQRIDFQMTDVPARRFLRVVGGVKFPGKFAGRGETMFRASEFLIDDNLDSLCTHRDRYSLYFKGDNDNFERLAFYRIPGRYLKAGEYTVTLPIVQKKNLAIDTDGQFGLQIGLYYKQQGRNENDIYDEPDSSLYIPIPEGSSELQQFTHTLNLPDNVACVFFQLGGTHFSGECWVEAPRLYQHRKEICRIPFTKYEQRTDSVNYWVGCNLATRSWPRWKLEANGITVFEGNIFDRASNVADFYIPLPASVRNHSELKLQLLKEGPRTSFPYEVHRVELIEETARRYEVISVPRYVSHNSAFGLLIETNEPNVEVKVTAKGEVSPRLQECFFAQPGLHVIELRAGEAGNGIACSIDDGTRTESVEVQQVIDKESDRIYVSSGDEIYIDKTYEAYNYFFKWYHHNRIGNWYQFRPSYQWSGFRIANATAIGHYTHLLNQLQMPYAWQVEGRTLAGNRINPSLEALQSPMFRGKQAHENDGGYYYWTHFQYEGLFSDIAAHYRPYGGIFAKHRPIMTDHGTFIHYDTEGVKDMADGARKFVANLQYSKGESTRHTGPSSLFRYFYQAGYDWLGAEQMYGPEETILSSLRGASRAYHKSEYGSLHAMQWGSGPFSDPKHSLRTYLSLTLAYMHGSSHMNTEEALWTDEYANDRYSKGGKEHLFAQHQVLDYVETHTRRGRMTSKIAIIQGRNDAWKSFVRGNLWSQKGEQWRFDKANESFDLINVFYPKNILDATGPDGWFTDTPYGTVDLLPIEAPREVMNQYRAMIFLGWNSFDEADFERIYDFVYQGGTLVLTAAHLNGATLPNVPTRFPKDDQAIRRMLGDGYQHLTEKTEISLGNGRIIYFPQSAYPADEMIRKDYEAVMHNLAKSYTANETNRGWITHNPAVGFSAWDSEARRTLYLLNIDWKSKSEVKGNLPETRYGEQPATFVYGQQNFPITVRRYHLETIHCAEGLAILPSANTSDVLYIHRTEGGWKVKVQTTDSDTFRCMQKNTGTDRTVHVERAGIHELFIAE